jgi:hypothetical protein
LSYVHRNPLEGELNICPAIGPVVKRGGALGHLFAVDEASLYLRT